MRRSIAVEKYTTHLKCRVHSPYLFPVIPIPHERLHLRPRRPRSMTILMTRQVRTRHRPLPPPRPHLAAVAQIVVVRAQHVLYARSPLRHRCREERVYALHATGTPEKRRSPVPARARDQCRVAAVRTRFEELGEVLCRGERPHRFGAEQGSRVLRLAARSLEALVCALHPFLVEKEVVPSECDQWGPCNIEGWWERAFELDLCGKWRIRCEEKVLWPCAIEGGGGGIIWCCNYMRKKKTGEGEEMVFGNRVCTPFLIQTI